MSSVTGAATGHGEPGLILLDAWRRELYEGVLGSRSRTLFSLVDSLAADQGRCGCPAHLSLGTVTGHAAAYRALRDGEIDTGRALRAACRIAARSGLPRIYAVDTTAWPRPNAPTSPDRQPQYTPGGPRGSALIKTGWRYQHVVRLTLTPDSWVVPVLADRIASDDDLTEVTVDHIARVCAADGARPTDRSLFLLDSGYPAARITHLLREREIPADVLVRLATSQTMWTRPEHKAAHPLGGRPRRHGFRLALREPDLPADTGVSGPVDIYGTVTVRAWHHVHPKLTRSSRGFTGQKILPIVEGTVLLARVQHLRPSRRAGDLALWYSGTRHDLLTLVMTYLNRFDIETAFLEMKSTTLDGRVLRARTPTGIEQEVYALLTTYQALRLAMTGATDHAPDIAPDRASFTIALTTARDQVIQAAGVIAATVIDLIGVIGRAVLADPLPARRIRISPRVVKRAISKHRAKGVIDRTNHKATITIALGLTSSPAP